MTVMTVKTFQLTVYLKAVHWTKQRIHWRFGMHFRSLIAEFCEDHVEMELDDVLRDVLKGRWGRVVTEVNA